MAGITEIPAGEAYPEILTSTGGGGLLGSQYLADAPLEAHLEGAERPRFVCQNKSHGLEIAGPEGDQQIEPDGDHQALLMVTDMHVRTVVGQASGDESETIRLVDVVGARTESSGLLANTLVIETLEDVTWRFPCRGDLGDVAEFVENAAQTWANASRLVDDVESTLAAVEDHLEANEHDLAREALEGSRSSLEAARARSQELGPGAAAFIADRVDAVISRLQETLREVVASHGGTLHTSAQTAWRDREYETAARRYEQAVETYEEALELDGTSPPDKSLIQRLRGAVAEREVLRVAPLVDADTDRRRALAIDDPEDAAEVWTDALEGYRDMLGLEWGRNERTFLADRDLVTSHAEAVAGDAIADHHDAGLAWLKAADKLAVQDRISQAEQVYERALDQFRRAHQLAREVSPDRIDDLETAITTVEKRLEGEGIPTERPPEEPLAAAAVSHLEGVEAEEDVREGAITGEGASEFSVPRSAGATDSDSSSALDRIQAKKQAGEAEAGGSDSSKETAGHDTAAEEATGPTDGGTMGPTEASDAATDVAVGETPGRNGVGTSDEDGPASPEENEPLGVGSDGPEAAGGADMDTAEASGTDNADALGVEAVETSDPEDTGIADAGADSDRDSSLAGATDKEIRSALGSIDESALTDLVAAVWEARGWATTVFTSTTSAVYDVVAIREDPDEERLLLWTVHRPDGGELGTTVVKRCATARDSSQGADRATLVTTGSLTNAAAKSAEDMDVTVLESADLSTLLREEGHLQALERLLE